MIASPRVIASLGLKMSRPSMVCPCTIPNVRAFSRREIIPAASAGISVNDVVVMVPVSMSRDFIVMARNSARVIGFSGLKVPSSYHCMIHLLKSVSMSSCAKDELVSVKTVTGEGDGVVGVDGTVGVSVTGGVGGTVGLRSVVIEYHPPPPPPPPLHSETGAMGVDTLVLLTAPVPTALTAETRKS